MRKSSKLITLLLAAGMVWSLSAPSVASAVDVKFSGTMDFSFERRNVTGTRETGSNQFDALQRLRLAMDFIASENLSARYMLQVGTGMWGSSTKYSAYGQDFTGGHQSYPGQSRITTRYMYLDWMVPNTQVKVRMGKQDIALPGFAFNFSPAAGGVHPGIVVNSPITENIGITAMWHRPSANERGAYANALEYNNRFRNTDIFSVALPMKFEGFQLAPYFQVASLGNQGMQYGTGAGSNAAAGTPWNANGEVNYSGLTAGRMPLNGGSSFGWWAGFASKLTMFDPFSVSLDFVYGSKNATGYNSKNSINNHYWFADRNGNDHSVKATKLAERSGWIAALRMDYKTEYGVPTLLGWYGTGDSANQTKGAGMMPTTSGNQAGCLGIAPTYFDNSWGLGAGANNGNTNIAGTWGVSLAWNKFSFVEDLYHDFSVTYFRGTNDKANVYKENNPHSAYSDTPWGVNAGYQVASNPYNGYLTNKDSAVDLSLSSTYAIYKNLAANLELGYMFTQFNEDIRANYDANGKVTAKPKYDNIWRVAVNFRYTF